ncbi:MAG: DNA internalization-related competence protein ComEC/Rec2 [Ottowia sp.]|nr:DNA internalization-related competence protein ComEC/Rec2 [Ottowia sp.]
MNEGGNTAWILTVVPLGWIAGTAVQLQQRELRDDWVYGAALLLALLLVAAARTGRRAGRDDSGQRRVAAVAVLAWLLAALLAAWGAAGWRAASMQQQALAPALEGVDLRLTGVIAAMPQQGEGGWRFLFDVENAELEGRAVAVPRRLQLSWYTRPRNWGDAAAAPSSHPEPGLQQPLYAGDRWQLTARLKAPHGNINPHGFDYELWLHAHRIAATGYVRINKKTRPPERLAQAVAHPVERLRQSVRDRILALAAADGSKTAAQRFGVVAALATGDQNAIARGDWDVFRVTGVAHLVSISGLHIGMMAWLASMLVGFLWRRSVRWRRLIRVDLCHWLPAPHAALLGALLFGTAYAVFSGWGVPAQRTVIMLASVIVLRLAGLRWPWWLTWLWTCMAVLAVDPWAFLQAGFWLSFVAVGILFVTGSRAVGEAAGWTGRLRGLLVTQTRITVALAPLTLILFGQASVVGLLANLVAIPWVTLIVTPTALAGLLWPFSWQVAAWSLWPLLPLLHALAAQPWAQLTAAAAPLLLGLAAAAGALLVVMRLPWSVRLGGVPLFLPLLLWQPARPPPGQFHVLALDVGQGSAILVQTAGHTLLYDAGPRFSHRSDAGERIVLPLLQALGENLDMLVLSHRDSDHTGGAAAVHAAFPQTPVVASLHADDALPGVSVGAPCRTGMRWNWDGVAFEVLYPDDGDVPAAGSSNAISCVLRVSNASVAALLSGDLEAAQERALVGRDVPLRSDVIVVPHHGSNTSSTDELLHAVQPRLALIQSGYRNRYGHPTSAVLARYARHDAVTYDSPDCGAMHWRSSAPAQLRCERELSRRYWRLDAVRAAQTRGDRP